MNDAVAHEDTPGRLVSMIDTEGFAACVAMEGKVLDQGSDPDKQR